MLIALFLGIIRNIDPINKLFYILTPERPEVLQHVNALLKGNVQLPVSYLIEVSDFFSNNFFYTIHFINKCQVIF